MSDRLYSVGEVARIAKVTIRTLHHYHEIGLLVPAARSAAGYRLYSREDIERLQQIRFHRELRMALEDIRGILDADDFDAERALRGHREILLEKLEKTRALVSLIDRMLASEGEEEMSARGIETEDLFDGFEPEQYEAEVEERWGESPAYRQAMRRTQGYGPDQWRVIKAEAEEIVAEMAAMMAAGEAPESEAARALAERHRQHIDRWFYACSHEMHVALAGMYVADPRFVEYFDRHGEGLAGWVEKAIQANAGA